MQVKKQQLDLNMEQQTGSKTGKEYIKGCVLSSCLFNLYAEYIIRNAGLEEAQAGIKISGRNLRFRNHITSDMQMTPPLWQKENKLKSLPIQYCKLINLQLK